MSNQTYNTVQLTQRSIWK